LSAGIHLTLDAQACNAHAALQDAPAFLAQAHAWCEAAGLTVVGTQSHHFTEGGGFTAVLLLAASHLSVHTWPEHSEVSADVYICHHSRDQTTAAEQLIEALCGYFKPVTQHTQRISRGGKVNLHDRLSEHSSLSLHNAQLLYAEQSAYQHIAFYQHADFGRLFTLDGALMTSERDEAIYHQAILSPLFQSLPWPQRVLILGGGDGGAAKVALTQPHVFEVIVAELDERVVSLCREHLPKVCGDAWLDPRCQLVIGDALTTLPRLSGQFDSVVFDLTDPSPDGLANPLYELPFLQAVHDKLSPDGVACLHIGSPFYQAARCETLLARLHQVFNLVSTSEVSVPLYGGSWRMAFAYKKA
jgi:spermidine synthase